MNPTKQYSDKLHRVADLILDESKTVEERVLISAFSGLGMVNSVLSKEDSAKAFVRELEGYLQQDPFMREHMERLRDVLINALPKYTH